MTKWAVEYLNGEVWASLPGQIASDGMVDELSTREESFINLVNTAANRLIVATDKHAHIKFNGTVVPGAEGILRPVDYSESTIRCRIDNEAFTTARGKEFEGDYSAGEAADVIFGAICTAAGLTAGTCPDTEIAPRFPEHSDCLECLKVVANLVQQDLYSSGLTVNVGTKGTLRSYAGVFGSDSHRKVDRTENVDKVYVYSSDSTGVIYGEAGGGSSNIRRFSYPKAADVDTLNKIAAYKLAELNKDSQGVPLRVPISSAVNWVSGDQLPVTRDYLDMDGTYTIKRITKHRTYAQVEIDTALPSLINVFEPLKETGDFSVYPATVENINVIPDFPVDTPVFAVLAEEIDTAASFRTWIKITITRLDQCGGYVIAYKKTSDLAFTEIMVEQSESGNLVVTTPDLPGSTQYDVKVCAISKLGKAGTWAVTQQPTTCANDTAPSAPTGVAAVAVANGFLASWTGSTSGDLAYYEVFKSLTNDPAGAVSVGKISGTAFYYHITDKDTEYAATYIWVSAVDTGGNSSAKTATTPTNVTPDKVDTKDVESIAATLILIDGTTYLSNWRKSADLTKIDGGQISTGTIAAGPLASTVLDRIFTDAATKTNMEAWRAAGDLTLINGGKIIANSIALAGLGTAVTDRMFSGDSVKAAVEAWRHGSDVTLIDGSKIYTGSIVLAKMGSDVTQLMFSTTNAKSNIEAWQKAGSPTYLDGDHIYAHTITAYQIDVIGPHNIPVEASDSVQNENPNNGLGGDGTWVKILTLTFSQKLADSCRIKFTVTSGDPYSLGYAQGQVYKNDVAWGSVWGVTAFNTPTVISEDFAGIAEGDEISLYARFVANGGATGQLCQVSNLKVCYSAINGHRDATY